MAVALSSLTYLFNFKSIILFEDIFYFYFLYVVFHWLFVVFLILVIDSNQPLKLLI